MLKDDVKKILDNNKLSNSEKLNKIVDLIVNRYFLYDKDEIKDLSKELAYKLIDALERKITYQDVFDDLREFYLED